MIWIGIAFLVVGLLINFIISDTHPGIYLGTLLACVGTALIAANHYEKKILQQWMSIKGELQWKSPIKMGFQ